MLKLKRTELHNVTLGDLSMNGKPLCKTIELPWIFNRRGTSCIPKGKYKMAYTYSPSFRRNTWRLLNVPDRDGILIHVANYTRQLRGCIAPCLTHADIDGDGVMDGASSATALDLVEQALLPYREKGYEIEIV